MDNRVYYGEYSLKHWIELILKQNIILPDYQRYFVWEEKKVSTLIDTFKKKQFVPPVTIGAFKEGGTHCNLVLDGQQRLTSTLLAFLGLYPDKDTYKKTVARFADENDIEEEAEEIERFDNVLAWTFKTLTEKGNSKEIILSKLEAGNYKMVNFDIDNHFLENTFLGFSYLVPHIADENEQQKYYSSVFRNINIQGQILLPQESRKSLYFLDRDLVGFFEPAFMKDIVVKTVSGEAKIDFVRCLSLLSQFYKDEHTGYIARSFKPEMEKYYEDYIYSVLADDDGKYAKFTDIFPGKVYGVRFLRLQDSIVSLKIPQQFSSIIDMDVYLFGLVYYILFEDKEIDILQKTQLKIELDNLVTECKNDPSHSRAPANLGHLRYRIGASIEIYDGYVSH